MYVYCIFLLKSTWQCQNINQQLIFLLGIQTIYKFSSEINFLYNKVIDKKQGSQKVFK